MTAEDFLRSLNELVDRKPFKAFVLEMNDGTQIEIGRSGSLAYRGNGASGFARGGSFVNVNSVNVKQIVDAPASVSGCQQTANDR
jgi:hypothetical protein